jgi:hypothetical protein
MQKQQKAGESSRKQGKHQKAAENRRNIESSRKQQKTEKAAETTESR